MEVLDYSGTKGLPLRAPASRKLTDRDGLPGVALRMLTDVNCQRDNRGPNALASDEASRSESLGIDSTNGRLRFSDFRGDVVHQLSERGARRLFLFQPGELCFRKLPAEKISGQPIGAAGNVVQMEAKRRDARRRSPDLRIAEARRVALEVFQHLLQSEDGLS